MPIKLTASMLCHLSMAANTIYTDLSMSKHSIITYVQICVRCSEVYHTAGADTYQRSRKHWVLFAVLLFCTALVALGCAAAHPWWHYHKAVLLVLLCVVAVCCTLAPISFIVGFAGFGGVAAALREDIQSLQLHMPACKGN